MASIKGGVRKVRRMARPLREHIRAQDTLPAGNPPVFLLELLLLLLLLRLLLRAEVAPPLSGRYATAAGR